MSQETRQGFETWQIDIAYESQQGLCLKCGAGLEQTGFHAHHKNEDNSDNTLENLELYCPKCHFSMAPGPSPWEEHKKVEKIVLDSLLKTVVSILDPASKLSGATLKELNDIMAMALRSSRYYNEIDYGRMQTPASIRIKRKLAENDMVGDSYISGYMDGVKATVSRVKGE
jgi:hypothetical protein